MQYIMETVNRLIVAGCSFSDWAEVETNYGEYLAEELSKPVIFYTSGCGSNQRIWRKLTKAIINKEITEKDLLIIQYTTPERKEFWSTHSSNRKDDYTRQGNPYKGSPMREKYLDGELIKFKVDAHQWQSVTEEKEFFKLYESNFLSTDFELEIFNTTSFMFQALLKEFKIPAIFLETIYTLPWPKLECDLHHTVDIKPLHVGSSCLEEYCVHLSKEGHQKVGSFLAKYIKEKVWQKQL